MQQTKYQSGGVLPEEKLKYQPNAKNKVRFEQTAYALSFHCSFTQKIHSQLFEDTTHTAKISQNQDFNEKSV